MISEETVVGKLRSMRHPGVAVGPEMVADGEDNWEVEHRRVAVPDIAPQTRSAAAAHAQRRPSAAFKLSQFVHTPKFRQFSQQSRKTTWMQRIIAFIFVAVFVILIIWFNVRPHDFACANNEIDAGVDAEGHPIHKHRCDNTTNALYYAATVTSTVGFGDICPVTPAAKLFTAAYQMYLTAISLGAVWYFTDGTLSKMAAKVKAKADLTTRSARHTPPRNHY